MAELSVEAVADAMYSLVRENHGKRNLKPIDLTKAMLERFGESCDKALCKAALRLLVDDGRCIYSYLGGSYLVLPPEG